MKDFIEAAKGLLIWMCGLLAVLLAFAIPIMVAYRIVIELSKVIF